MIRTLIKLHNASYWMQKSVNLILAGIIIWAVLIFVTIAAPHVAANIIHDILTGK